MLTASTVDSFDSVEMETELIINCPVGIPEISGSQKFGQGTTCDVPVDPGETEPPAGDELSPGEERAHGLVRGLCLVLRHHNAPKSVMDSFKTQTLAYLNCEEAVFVKRAKWLTTYPMAVYLGAEKPKEPAVVLKYRGQYRNWSRLRLRDFTKRNTHLWYSFLQAKRACHPLTEEMVHSAYEEHRAAMEIEDPITPSVLEGVLEELEPVLAEVASQVARSYAPMTLEEHLEAHWDVEGDTRHVASTRACYEMSREKGGQLGQLSYLTWKSRVQAAPLPDLVAMAYQPLAIVCGVPQRNVVTEIYRFQDDMIAWKDTIRGHALHYRGNRVLKATIQVVLEPLKTRVISKGEAVPYYVSKPLQKVLHTVLRRMPAFRLIGRPLSAPDLMDLEANRVELGQGRYEWFSIDYSAATDGLSASLSARILDRILKSQSTDLREIWMKVLAPHLCRYPFPHDDVQPVQQRNGQLMGSILSFPILCLANLGLYLYTIRSDPRALREKMAGVLVNGDDMLYVARRSVWNEHVANGLLVGLKMSAGKAYHHPQFANANSACFHYSLKRVKTENWDGMQAMTLDGHVATPVAIPFLNSGLYFGQNKVMNKVSETGSEVTSRVTVIGELLKGCRGPHRLTREIYRGYLHRHGREIAEECRGRNIFIPCSLGGMGVESHISVPVRTSLAQRQEAMERYQSNPFGWFGYGPLPGPEVPDTPTPLCAPWLVPSKPAVERRYLKVRRGQKALSPGLCVLPFRTCSVRRHRSTLDFDGLEAHLVPRGLPRVPYRYEVSEWEGLDGEVLSFVPQHRRCEDRVVKPVRKLKPLLPRMQEELVWRDHESTLTTDSFDEPEELRLYHLRLDCDHHQVDSPSIVECW